MPRAILAMILAAVFLAGAAEAQLIKPSDLIAVQKAQESANLFNSAANCMEAQSMAVLTQVNTREEAIAALVKACGQIVQSAHDALKAAGLPGVPAEDAPPPAQAARDMAKQVIELQIGPEDYPGDHVSK